MNLSRKLFLAINMKGRRKNIPTELLRRSARNHQPSDDNNIFDCNDLKRNKLAPEQIRKKAKIECELVEKQDVKDNFKSNANNVPIKREIEPIIPTIRCDKEATDECTKLLKPDGFIDIDAKELDLERTLLGGQSFRWTKNEIVVEEKPYSLFTGIILNHALRLWRISHERVAFKILNKEAQLSTTIPLLEDYFQINYNLKDLYKEWSSKDPHLANCCNQYYGFRILRQDPVENIFSFICATNNNIKRISQMVEKICKRYGSILECNGQGKQSVYDSYYSFPSVERLAESDVFDCLRHELGFGYRAKFITGTAEKLVKLASENNETPREYLINLRKLTYKETRTNLITFPGIGRKVADCICLMSMDHLNAVPIDCHIYEIVCRHYLQNLRKDHKTLTDNVHDLIGDYFKNLHGDLAGWSTSVLFIAELKHLKMEETSNSLEKKQINNETKDGKKSKSKTKNKPQDHS